jgi:hypothetical protein
MISTPVSNKAVIVDTSRSPHAQLKAVPMNNINLEEGFWQSRVRTIQVETLISQYRLLE